jgi:hypothetical protein
MGRPRVTLASIRIVSAALALLVGVVLALYGIILILYRGDAGGDGDTYVSLGGTTVDADLAAAVTLVMAAALIAFSIWAFRSRMP